MSSSSLSNDVSLECNHIQSAKNLHSEFGLPLHLILIQIAVALYSGIFQLIDAFSMLLL